MLAYFIGSITAQFDEAASFSEGLALVSKDDMTYFVVPKGNKTINIAAKKTTAGVTPSEQGGELGTGCKNTTYNLCICNTLEYWVKIDVSETSSGDWGPS